MAELLIGTWWTDLLNPAKSFQYLELESQLLFRKGLIF